MGKGTVVIIIALIIIVILIGWAFVAWFTGFVTKITGDITGAAVTTENCTDTDGGLNYYVKGELVNLYPNPVADVCSTQIGTRLVEYVCEADETSKFYRYYDCPNGCEAGACITICGDGVCVGESGEDSGTCPDDCGEPESESEPETDELSAESGEISWLKKIWCFFSPDC